MFFTPRKILLLIFAALVIGGFMAWRQGRTTHDTPLYRTAELIRANLLITINATGTVEPEEVIDVGAQVAGQILSFGTDAKGKTIDYGSEVEAGMVLARIDDSLYQADVIQAEAGLQSSRAGLLKAQAELHRAEQDWKRAQRLRPTEALAPLSLDNYEAIYKVAAAQIAVQEGAIRQAEAALIRARRNLGYCTISSPVKGVIIDRRVNTGQTVVASLNAPSLFLLARDLTRVQVWVAVNEADIGKIKPGQPVSFTVDAFPDDSFQGTVGKIRLNAAMTQNVVSYTVEIITDNQDGRLLPYLTANVSFHLQHFDQVLQAPNAALRWSPVSTGETGKKKKENAPASQSGQGKERNKGTLWLLDDHQEPRPLEVLVGASDGSHTVVTPLSDTQPLREGMRIITGVNSSEAKAGENKTGNPFTPKFGASKNNAKGGEKRSSAH